MRVLIFADRCVSAKIKPMNFSCLYGSALGLERPRKLNRENLPSDQSMKIGPLKDFPLYGIYNNIIHYTYIYLLAIA